MVDINDIMDLLDWNQSAENQAKGRALGQDIECINVFLQPCNKNSNKNVWENCAKILSERTNEEFSPYLVE